MKRIILLVTVALVMAALTVTMALPVFAEPQGKGPGPCVAPGTVLSEFAKQPGTPSQAFPAPYTGVPPGQVVKDECTPAGS